MNLKTIIADFLKSGCIDGKGVPLPFSNCESLHREYTTELKKLGCKCRKKAVDVKWRLKLKKIINTEGKLHKPVPSVEHGAPPLPEHYPAHTTNDPSQPFGRTGSNGKPMTPRGKDGNRLGSKANPFGAPE